MDVLINKSIKDIHVKGKATLSYIYIDMENLETEMFTIGNTGTKIFRLKT